MSVHDSQMEEQNDEEDDGHNPLSGMSLFESGVEDEEDDDDYGGGHSAYGALDGGHHTVDTHAINEVRDQTFEEVQLPEAMVQEVMDTWAAFISSQSSREVAGDMLYGAVFDAVPSLQSLFKTPRAVMALRIMNGVNTIVNSLRSPNGLKTCTETLGFQHLEFDITVPRVSIFRDSIIDLLEMELGDRLTSAAKIGWRSVLNYVGGAFIYVRVNYSVRLKIIAQSWATANNKAAEYEALNSAKEDEEAQKEEGKEGETDGHLGSGEHGHEEATHGKEGQMEQQNRANKDIPGRPKTGEEESGKKKPAMKVPTTFNEMFMFNGAVMGFANQMWMHEVLDSFDTMVKNASNTFRLQEECDTLSLRLAKHRTAVRLAEFKAIMLASLRSLVPKDWDSAHEVAWVWLWENVERLLRANMGKPQVQEKSLAKFIGSLTEESQNYLRRELYRRFFALAPLGQDFFKQSTTRLYWIADRVVEMTVEMYKEPRKMVEVISAVGLRHVGYGVPTEFFPPYVSGWVEVVKTMTQDKNAEDGFRWSLSLISRILVRTINEGSTIVMQAINTNSAKQLRKAVACAPKGKRAMWMLNITVGTQSISPLYWAIESGSLDTANAMIDDLLIIRADRDNYYYGCDDLFTRHPDIILRLCTDADGLLPTLLNGLIWRSRITVNGNRRVNYYVKHLIQDHEEKFCDALQWFVDHVDPKIICHPVVVLFSDLLWTRVASRYFLIGRFWFVFTLLVFLISQSILQEHVPGRTGPARVVIFLCRLFIYIGSASFLIRHQIMETARSIKAKDYVRVLGLPFPAYLEASKERVSLALIICIIVMLSQEPIFYCFQTANGDWEGSGMFTQNCPQAGIHKRAYQTFSMIGMFLYWTLVTDLTIFSMRISAFVLVCGRVLSEVGLFLSAIAFLIITFASSIGTLQQKNADFADIPKGALTLLLIFLGMYDTTNFDSIEGEAMVLISVCVFIIIAVIFLMNLLIAQLNGAYQAIYSDMVGYARLNRGKVICETMVGVTSKRWSRFLESLRFGDRLEFNEGDIGVAGGIQVLELGSLNPTTKDEIRRFGGSTNPAMQWPEGEDATAEDDESKFERLEKMLIRAQKNIGEGGGGPKKKTGGGGGASSVASDDSDE